MFSASRTTFATNLISGFPSLLEFDAFSRSSSRCSSTKAAGSWISSINWRMHGRPRKYLRTLRSFFKRYVGAVLTTTVAVFGPLLHVKQGKRAFRGKSDVAAQIFRWSFPDIWWVPNLPWRIWPTLNIEVIGQTGAHKKAKEAIRCSAATCCMWMSTALSKISYGLASPSSIHTSYLASPVSSSLFSTLMRQLWPGFRSIRWWWWKSLFRRWEELRSWVEQGLYRWSTLLVNLEARIDDGDTDRHGKDEQKDFPLASLLVLSSIELYFSSIAIPLCKSIDGYLIMFTLCISFLYHLHPILTDLMWVIPFEKWKYPSYLQKYETAVLPKHERRSRQKSCRISVAFTY